MGLFTQEEFNDIQKSLEAMTNWFNNKMTKPDNNVPKSIKGDYGLSIHGNKIVLVDNVDGTTVEAKCHPDDDFDIGIGITEVFKKLNVKREEIRKAKEDEEKKIKVGDWVEVINPGGGSYPGRADFFNQHKTREYAPYYRFGVVPKKGSIGKVVYIEEKPNEINNIYVIQENYSPCYGEKEFKQLKYANGIYLVTINGIRKVAKPQ